MKMIFTKMLIIFLFLLPTSLGSQMAKMFKNSNHTNNWAVLVETSRFWFNYRCVANVLSIYRSVKRLGIPDSQIILMLADDIACNPRNPRPATIFNDGSEKNIYGDDIEVDYRGYEVTVETMIRLLTGRVDAHTPRSKRLLTDEGSNILIYMSGHGGDGFLKFQDYSEISDIDIADTFEQMWQKRRYNEILFMVDSCQAASMFNKFYTPNIIAVGSSLVGEQAYSHHTDKTIGVPVVDKFTYYIQAFLEKMKPNSRKTLSQLFSVCKKNKCLSTTGFRTDLFKRNSTEVLITDFFGSVRPIIITTDPIDIVDIPKRTKKAKNKTKVPEKRGYLPQFPMHLVPTTTDMYNEDK